MPDPEDTQHLNATEARGGATPGVARYVLGISLVLVIVAFFLVWKLA